MSTIALLLPRSLNLFSLIDMQIARQIFYSDVFYWFWEELDYKNSEDLIDDIHLALPLADVLWLDELTVPVLNLATKVRWIHVNKPIDPALIIPKPIRVTVSGNLDSTDDNLNSIFTPNVLKLYSQIQSNHLKKFIRLLV